MIDHEDGDFALLLSGSAGMIGVIFLLVLAMGLYYLACQNEKECSTRTCPSGEVARLLDHECVCTSNPN
jgi:hypothetical protein